MSCVCMHVRNDLFGNDEDEYGIVQIPEQYFEKNLQHSPSGQCTGTNDDTNRAKREGECRFL
jgi:hypothetical protein